MLPAIFIMPGASLHGPQNLVMEREAPSQGKAAEVGWAIIQMDL